MAVLPFRTELEASGAFVYFGDSVPSSGDFFIGDLLIVTNTSAASPGASYPAMYRCTTASVAHNGGSWTALGQPTGGGSGTVLAAASTIAPSAGVTHISGTTAIAIITPPAGFPKGGYITLLPDSGFTTIVTAGGNIGLGSTAVSQKALIETWDGTSWYPSYLIPFGVIAGKVMLALGALWHAGSGLA